MIAAQQNDGRIETEFGAMPSDWTLSSIGDLGKVVTGSTPSTKHPEYYGGQYKFISPSDLNGSRYLRTSEKSLTREGLSVSRILPSKSVLVSCIGYIGKTGLTCSAKNDPEFVYHLVTSLAPFIAGRARKTTVPIINKGVFESLPIPLPPLPEQRRIAAVLNTIQDAIAAQEDVIAAARHFKRSLMQRLFTYGPGREPAETKETEIGEIPAHWEVRELGTIYGIQQGKALSGRKQKTGDETYPFLRTSNVYWGRTELATLDSMPFSAVEREKLRLRTNDLLICEGGDIGRTALWRDELADCFYQNHLFRVRAKTSNVEPAFHMYWMQAALTLLGLYGGAGNKTTIPNLSQSRLSSFLIPLPPLPEQRRIASILNTADAKIAEEEDRKTALDALFKSMLHQLMTGRIRLLTDEGLALPKN